MTLASGVRRYALYAVVLVAAATAITAVVVVSGRARAAASADRVAAHLQEADSLLGLGATPAARQPIVAAAGVARSEHDHLRVLKRALSAASADGGWEWLFQLARAAHDSMPGSPAIRQAVIYAALRAGRGADALAVVESGRGTADRGAAFQFLAAEALVAAGASAGGASGAAAELAPDLVDLVSAPSLRDSEALLALGLRMSPDLVQDAALRYAAEGELDTASDLYEQHLTDAVYDMPAFLIAYDAGRLETAQRRLAAHRATRGDEALTLQLAGDLALQDGRRGDAADLYRRVTSLEPTFAWQPYLNLARIHADAGDLVESVRVLASGLPLFPDAVPLTVAVARVYQTAGHLDDRDVLVERVAALLAELDVPALDLELALLELRGPTLGAERLSGSLWQLGEAHPGHQRLQRVLSTRVLAAGDLSSAAMVLRRVEAQGGVLPAWWHELRGVAAAMEGQLQPAVDALSSARTKDATSWTVPYNLAVVLSAAGRHDRAWQELEEAARRLREFGNAVGAGGLDTRQATARIRTRLGEVRWRSGDLAGARRDLEFATELDPAYTRARVMINRLVNATGN